MKNATLSVADAGLYRFTAAAPVFLHALQVGATLYYVHRDGHGHPHLCDFRDRDDDGPYTGNIDGQRVRPTEVTVIFDGEVVIFGDRKPTAYTLVAVPGKTPMFAPA